MQFKFETDYNLKSLTVMAKALRKTVRKARSKKSHILGWILVAFSVFLLFTSAKTEFGFRQIVTLLVAVAVAVSLIFEDRLNGYFAKRNMLKGTEKAVAVFDTQLEDTFSSETGVGKSEFYYKNIVAIAETKEYFVFLLSASYAQVYDKSTLCGGTDSEFRQFITKKTGKTITNVD